MHNALKWFFLSLWIIGTGLGVSAAEKELPTVCKRCSMHLDAADKKFSVTIAEGIEASAFDDIGCALLWRDGECAMRMSAFDSNARVYDYGNAEPVVIEQAYFVHGAGLKTPMGYDIAAFKKKEDAKKLKKEKGRGEVMTFSQVCSLKLESHREGKHYKSTVATGMVADFCVKKQPMP